jgi:hypothetical protein
MYAGISAGAVDSIEPAGDIVRRIVAEADLRLAAVSTSVSTG